MRDMVMSTLCLSCEFSFKSTHSVPTTSNNSLKPLPTLFLLINHPNLFFFLLKTFNNSNKKSQPSLIISSLMEIKSTLTTYFLLLILILALSPFSRGESEALHSEIYEIDYRGPETHSSIVPPPHHFHIGKPHSTTPQKGSLRGTKALRDYSYAENKVKKVHG